MRDLDAPPPAGCPHCAGSNHVGLNKSRGMQRHTLIIRLDAIGDYILFRNVLRFIRRSAAYRDTHLTVLGNPAWRGLAEAFDADLADKWIWVENRAALFRKSIENLLPYALWHRRMACAQAAFRAPLLATHYDEVLSLQPIRDPLLDELVAGLAPEVVGIAGPGGNDAAYTRLLNPGPDPFVFLRNRCAAADLTGEPCNIPLALDCGATQSNDEILIFTGASHWTKRWPRRNIRAFIQLLLKNTGLRVVLADGHSGSSLRSFAVSFQSDRVTAMSPLPLAEFARRVASVRAVIANDTMALHLAAATKTPTVGIVNGISGRDNFWPYPALNVGTEDTRPPAIRICGEEHGGIKSPTKHAWGLAAMQLAQARNLAAISADEVFAALKDVLDHNLSS